MGERFSLPIKNNEPRPAPQPNIELAARRRAKRDKAANQDVTPRPTLRTLDMGPVSQVLQSSYPDLSRSRPISELWGDLDTPAPDPLRAPSEGDSATDDQNPLFEDGAANDSALYLSGSQISLGTDSSAADSDTRNAADGTRSLMPPGTPVSDPKGSSLSPLSLDAAPTSGGSPDTSYTNSRAWGLFSSATAQAVASGITFGSKPFVEAGIEQVLRELKLDAVDAGMKRDLAKVISNIAGGVYVGLVHHALNASVGAYTAAKLDAPSFVDAVSDDGIARPKYSMKRRTVTQLANTALPVTLSFSAAFSAGDVLSAKVFPDDKASNIWVAAGMRNAQTMAGGFVQGGITAAIKYAMSGTYHAKTQSVDLEEVGARFKSAFSEQFALGRDVDTPRRWEGMCKLVGSALGMGFATYAAPAAEAKFHGSNTSPIGDDALAQAIGGTTGMVAYCAAWFSSATFGTLMDHYRKDFAGMPDDSWSPLPLPYGDEDPENPLLERNRGVSGPAGWDLNIV